MVPCTWHDREVFKIRVSGGKNYYSISCPYARSQNGQMQDGHEHKPPPHGSVADVGPHSSGGTYVERSKNHWLIAHTGSFLWEAYPCRRNNPAFYLLNHHGWSQKQFLGQYCFPTLLKNNWNYQNNFLLVVVSEYYAASHLEWVNSFTFHAHAQYPQSFASTLPEARNLICLGVYLSPQCGRKTAGGGDHCSFDAG